MNNEHRKSEGSILNFSENVVEDLVEMYLEDNEDYLRYLVDIIRDEINMYHDPPYISMEKYGIPEEDKQYYQEDKYFWETNVFKAVLEAIRRYNIETNKKAETNRKDIEL